MEVTRIIACEVFRTAINYLKLEDRYPNLRISYLPSRLHLKPLKLKERLLREVKKAQGRNERVICLYALPQIFLEKGDVYLNRRNHRSDDSHCLCAKIEDCIHCCVGVVLVVHLAMALDCCWKPAVNGIQPDNQRCLPRPNDLTKAVGKMTCHTFQTFLSSSIDSKALRRRGGGAIARPPCLTVGLLSLNTYTCVYARNHFLPIT